MTSDKAVNGYHGSVCSRQYSKIWKSEIKQSPHLFKTSIVHHYNTRAEALEAERRLQLKLKVVRSPMYINQAIAAPNGFFGASCQGPNPKKACPGKKNGMFGKTRTTDECRRISEARMKRHKSQDLKSYSRVKGEEERRKLSEAQKVRQAGPGNNRARHWVLTTPSSETINLHGNFKAWCSEHGMPSSTPVLKIDGSLMSIGKWAGWKVQRL